MKDKEARKMIKRIAQNIGVGAEFKGEDPRFQGGGNFLHRAESLLGELRDISIKDCPVCKHPVMAKLTEDRNVWYYRCLACGSKFTCSEKCVCELLKEEL